MTTTFHSTRSTTDSLTAKQAIRKASPMTAACSFRTRWARPRWTWPPCRASRTRQIAAEVLGALLPDFTAEELGQCIADAYGEQWSDERITRSSPWATITCSNCSTARLPRSRTWRCRSCRASWRTPRRADGDADEKIMILTATSGDTGKAALAGFADARAPRSPVFYPEGKAPRSRSCR